MFFLKHKECKKRGQYKNIFHKISFKMRRWEIQTSTLPFENKVVCRQGRVQKNDFSLENCFCVHVIYLKRHQETNILSFSRALLYGLLNWLLSGFNEYILFERFEEVNKSFESIVDSQSITCTVGNGLMGLQHDTIKLTMVFQIFKDFTLPFFNRLLTSNLYKQWIHETCSMI